MDRLQGDSDDGQPPAALLKREVSQESTDSGSRTCPSTPQAHCWQEQGDGASGGGGGGCSCGGEPAEGRCAGEAPPLDSISGKVGAAAAAAGAESGGNGGSGGNTGYCCFGDQYSLLGRIGEGAFSQVFLARHRVHRNRVAVKYYAARQLSPAQLAVVRNEVHIMREVTHPCCVRMHEVYMDGVNAAHIYIVQDWARGGSLLDELHGRRGGGLLPEAAVRAALRRVLTALAHLHSIGIVHRDVKPDNVLLLERGNYSTAVLADFGFATRTRRAPKPQPPPPLDPPLSIDDSPTASETASAWGDSSDSGNGDCCESDCGVGAVLGTAEYVAPETLRREPCDGRVDVWSAGVLTFAVLSGSLPFSGRDRARLFENILEGEAKFSGPAWARVSRGGKRLVVDMLQVAPEHRATAQELLSNPWLAETLP